MTDLTPEELAVVPEGWSPFKLASHYSQTLSPTYFSKDPVGLGFVARKSHSNLNGVVHGGALATLADISLFMIAARGQDLMTGATLSLNVNYLSPAKLGEFIHCEGRIVREGSSIIFVEGSAFAGENEVMTFNGVIKRFKPRP